MAKTEIFGSVRLPKIEGEFDRHTNFNLKNKVRQLYIIILKIFTFRKNFKCITLTMTFKSCLSDHYYGISFALFLPLKFNADARNYILYAFFCLIIDTFLASIILRHVTGSLVLTGINNKIIKLLLSVKKHVAEKEPAVQNDDGI